MLLLFVAVALVVLIHELASSSAWWPIHRSHYVQALILALIPLVHERQQNKLSSDDGGSDDVAEHCTPAALRCAESGGWAMRVCQARMLYLDLSKIYNCAGRSTWKERKYAFDRNCFGDGAFVVAPCRSSSTSIDLLSDISALSSKRRIHLRSEPMTSSPMISLAEYSRTILHVRDTYTGYYHRFANDALSMYSTLCRLQLGPGVDDDDQTPMPSAQHGHAARSSTRSLLLLLDPFPAHDGYDWIWQLSIASAELDIRSYRDYGRKGYLPTLNLSNAVLLTGPARLQPFYSWSPAAVQLRAPSIASVHGISRCYPSFAMSVRARLGLDHTTHRDTRPSAAHRGAVRVLFVLRAPPTGQPPPCSRAMANAAEVVSAAQQLANESSLPFTVTAYYPGKDTQLSKQLPTFAQADVLVGMHGAGLTNMAVMPPSSTVVEIFSHGHDFELYYLMARAFGHAHVHFRNLHPELHTPCNRSHLDASKYGNTIVRVEEFLPVLHRAIRAQARRRPPTKPPRLHELQL